MYDLTPRERIDRVEFFLRLIKAAAECRKAGIKPNISDFINEYRASGKRSNPDYHKNYYQQNRERLIAYQKAYQKEYKRGVRRRKA